MNATQDPSLTVKIIYILYLVGLIFGVTALIGVVMAYMNQSNSSNLMQSHYRFQIRTFWIGLGLIIIGSILTIVLIGFAVIAACYIWFIIRCVKGLQSIAKQQAIANPDTWLF